MTTAPISSMPPIVARVRSFAGEYFLSGEVSAMLGTSTATLRRLAVRQPNHLAPDRGLRWGSRDVAVYNMAVIERLARYLAEHRTGRGHPRLWADAELANRRAAFSKVGHRRRTAAAYRRRGDDARADQFTRDADRLQQQLQHEHRLRLAAVREGHPPE